MSSPTLSASSSGTPKSAEQFEDLWRQLRDCHDNALQELEAKVSKLKKERCLDAQRLEVFYNRNQQLKEQNKTLQDTNDLLEGRLRGQECERCAILEEDLKNKQYQNLSLITKLKNERKSLEIENRKLQSELLKLKTSLSELQQASSSDQEEDIIPNSPLLPSSLPIVGKLRRHPNPDKTKHVRYAETPLPWSNSSLFNELNKVHVDAAEKQRRTEVLVPNTCELDASQISNDVDSEVAHPEEVIAETCGLLDKPHMRTETITGQPSSSKSPRKHNIYLKPHRSSSLSTLIHSPKLTTERSPSLLPRLKRFSEDGSANEAKRKKEESEPESLGNQNQEVEGKCHQLDLIKQSSSSSSSQRLQEQLDGKVQSAHNGTLNQTADVSCFKKPDVRGEAKKDGGGEKGKPLQELNVLHDQQEGGDDERKHKVEPMWSIDPALALSMYDNECREDEEEECHAEMADTDCTWISHSVLQRQLENSPDREESVCGLGEKANDSLDMMFDTTTYGEYKSFSGSQSGQRQPCEEDEEEDENDDENDSHENTMSQRNHHKAKYPTFAHVAVIRKRDERRKLKATTCKECEVYYAHLPEEEKEKKLSACSRHRFLYIPPSTPENFWEVGFPSTQTCIERGYIKEEANPLPRSRRRQPFNALFSPKKTPAEELSKSVDLRI